MATSASFRRYSIEQLVQLGLEPADPNLVRAVKEKMEVFKSFAKESFKSNTPQSTPSAPLLHDITSGPRRAPKDPQLHRSLQQGLIAFLPGHLDRKLFYCHQPICGGRHFLDQTGSGHPILLTRDAWSGYGRERMATFVIMSRHPFEKWQCFPIHSTTKPNDAPSDTDVLYLRSSNPEALNGETYVQTKCVYHGPAWGLQKWNGGGHCLCDESIVNLNEKISELQSQANPTNVRTSPKSSTYAGSLSSMSRSDCSSSSSARKAAGIRRLPSSQKPNCTIFAGSGESYGRLNKGTRETKISTLENWRAGENSTGDLEAKVLLLAGRQHKVPPSCLSDDERPSSSDSLHSFASDSIESLSSATSLSSSRTFGGEGKKDEQRGYMYMDLPHKVLQGDQTKNKGIQTNHPSKKILCIKSTQK
ncbi:hypothetical protein B0O99DRAFT_284488 [Bisporella sp. PMI_857]|nr:hypothetical protein B0O99DRAFT_284488 [Bisporella sp. PMI_857]